MRSPSSNFTFSRVPSVDIPRSSFKRDRTYKTAFNANVLVPIFLDEVLPGDTFNLSLTSFARLSTPIVPFMDNLYMDYFFFFVPNRLVWDHWQEFNGEQKNPGDSTDYLVPQWGVPAGFAVGGLPDYFGLPVGVQNLSVSALPFRAYNLIWNEFFRDENFQDSVPFYTDDGPDPSLSPGTFNVLYKLLPRGKRKDYFTSCLPSPQKGPGVEIPIGTGMAPLVNTNSKDKWVSPNWFTLNDDILSPVTSSNLVARSPSGPLSGTTSGASVSNTFGNVGTTLAADLSGLTLTTINSLRTAFQIQRQYEKDARGGTRYFEILVSNFGVRSPDSRLQRPEYLGGGTVPIQIHTVAQTSSTDATSPQGNLAAIGVAGTNRVGFSKSFVEHGYIIGLVSVRADLTYQQGIDRHWSRRSRFDFYWPALAHLGEQAVLNKEIFAQGPSVVDDDGNVVDDKAFGYQERWAEYCYGVSKITGKLRSGVSGSLDVWHLAQHFESLPTLSADFIEENVPLSRVLAVQDEPQIIYDSLVSVNCVRCMPVYSVPGLIDHF